MTGTERPGRVLDQYDSQGRLSARVLPDGSRETMAYDADGTLTSHTNFNGEGRTFEYDANQRLTRRAYPDGSATTFTYTPSGQRATATDSRATTSTTYDGLDRLLEKIDPMGYRLSYTSYTYDTQGNRTSLTATVGTEVFTTTYGYDALNRLATVTDSENGVTTLGYDPNGNQASLAHPNGVTTDYTYDALNRLRNLSTAAPIGGVLASYAYTLGAAGHRTRIDEHDGTSRHYTYDDLYRLTQDRVTDPAAALVYQHDFTYDAVGNRLRQVVDEGGGPTAIASSYDARDRLLAAAAMSYAWDTNGNLSSRSDGGSTSYGWDFDDHLTSVTLDDGTLVKTIYDADMNRVRTEVTPPRGPTAAVDYLVDTTGFLSHVVADVVDGSVETLYTRANDQLIGLHRPASGTQRYFHADGLGSVRLLTDGAGVVSDRYANTAFGELLDHSGSDPQPYRFAGEPFDPNIGFYYNRARWVDPSVGRFASVDPFPGLLRDPSSLHQYLFTRADPVNRADPTGEFSLLSLAVTAAIITGLAAATITALKGGNPREIFFNGIGVAAATFLLVFYGLPILEGLIARYWPLLIAVGGGIARGGKTLRRVLCFPPGTSVLMADGGTKPIEDVQEGDLVVAANPEKSAEVFPRSVIGTTTNKTMRLFLIEFDIDGDGEADGQFEATGEHPIWTQKSGWRNAEDLAAGNLLQTHEGQSATVVRIEQEPGFSRTFNLTVEDAHTFFIVSNGVSILVHNNPRIHAPNLDWATKGAHVTTSQGIEIYIRGAGSAVKVGPVFARDANNPALGSAIKEVENALKNPSWRARLLDHTRKATTLLQKGNSLQRAASGGTRALEITLERWCK